MPDPIAEAFVRLRPDLTDFTKQVQAGVQNALGQVRVNQGQLAFTGPGFQQAVNTATTGAANNVKVPDTTQRNLAQQLFGPGFRNETGRAIQGALVGLGGGQLAAQFAFFGPGGAALTVLAGGFVAATRAAAKLDQQLEILAATTQASVSQVEQAREAALRLGADLSLPGVNASEAAKAITELAKAGLSVEESIAGVEGTLRLAIAAEIDTATASQIAAAGLNAFNLAGTEAAHVADLLAGASIAAQGDIGDMALALQQSAAVANQAGLTIDQLTAVITELARQGILGSDAGTSIRTMLLRLVPTTKEASATMEALGVQLDSTRTLGEQLPEIIDDYRSALSQLPPIIRQAALQQIFGTDAIRAATVIFGAGAAELKNLEEQVSRTGSAQELTEARTKGLSGEFKDLAKNIAASAIALGEDLAPGLETYLGLANAVLDRSPADEFAEIEEQARAMADAFDTPAEGIRVLTEQLDHLHTPEGIRLTQEALRQLRVEAGLAVPKISDITRAIDDAGFAFADTKGLSQQLRQELGRLPTRQELEVIIDAESVEEGVARVVAAAERAGTLGVGVLSRTLQQGRPQVRDAGGFLVDGLAALTPESRAGGEKVGASFVDGVADEITEQEQRAIDSARRALEDVRREGERQVQAAIQSARENLEGLGESISSQLETVIDAGPIADAIKRIDEELEKLQDNISRRQLRFDLTQAKQDLEEARDSIVHVGVVTPEMRQQQQEFLAPFKEKVKDAKAALKEFDLTEHQEQLQKSLDEQKKLAEEGLAKLIDRFEEGKISVEQFDNLLQQQLAPHLRTIAANGENLGFVFTRQFKRDMAELVEQAKALAGFQGRIGTTPGVNVVRPGQTVADVQRQLADSQRALAQAIKDAKDKNTEENTAANALLTQIRNALRGGPSKQTPPGPR